MAIFNSQLEADFLRQAQKLPRVTDRSYWIGGSTNIGHLKNFGFSNYKPYDDGNIVGDTTRVTLLMEWALFRDFFGNFYMILFSRTPGEIYAR